MRRTSTLFRLIPLAAVLLIVGLSIGCQSNTIMVTVPRIERFKLSNPDTPQLKIDRALSERAEAYAHTRPFTVRRREVKIASIRRNRGCKKQYGES